MYLDFGRAYKEFSTLFRTFVSVFLLYDITPILSLTKNPNYVALFYIVCTCVCWIVLPGLAYGIVYDSLITINKIKIKNNRYGFNSKKGRKAMEDKLNEKTMKEQHLSEYLKQFFSFIKKCGEKTSICCQKVKNCCKDSFSKQKKTKSRNAVDDYIKMNKDIIENRKDRERFLSLIDSENFDEYFKLHKSMKAKKDIDLSKNETYLKMHGIDSPKKHINFNTQFLKWAQKQNDKVDQKTKVSDTKSSNMIYSNENVSKENEEPFKNSSTQDLKSNRLILQTTKSSMYKSNKD